LFLHALDFLADHVPDFNSGSARAFLRCLACSCTLPSFSPAVFLFVWQFVCGDNFSLLSRFFNARLICYITHCACVRYEGRWKRWQCEGRGQ
jgi:hypothetical protein